MLFQKRVVRTKLYSIVYDATHPQLQNTNYKGSFLAHFLFFNQMI